MKLKSVIWTYILLSFLYSNDASLNSVSESFRSKSLQDEKIAKIDSVYSVLSEDQKIELLSLYSLSGNEHDTVLATMNGFWVSEKDSTLSLKKYTHERAISFEKKPISVAMRGEGKFLVNNLTIGQTNEIKFAHAKQSILSEEYKARGINVILGNFFQTYNNKLQNENEAYTQSPLSSEKYWQAALLSAEENGVKLGISDPFMLKLQIDSLDKKEFQAIGLSGNRYYARRGHGIIQLNENEFDFNERVRSEGKNEQTFLRENYNYSGIILSPDLSGKSTEEQVRLALANILKGTDLVCITLNAKKELDSLLKIHFENRASELKEKCFRILSLKYDLNKKTATPTDLRKYAKAYEYQVFQAANTCVKNENNVLPIRNLNQSIYYFTSTQNETFFKTQLEQYTFADKVSKAKKTTKGICLVDGMGKNLVEALKWADKYSGELKLILVTNTLEAIEHRTVKLDKFDALVFSGSQCPLAQEISLQSLFGAYSFRGKLPYYFSPNYPMGAGIELSSLSRLAYVAPEYVGVSALKMDEIDAIVNAGISARAFPGCQVIVGFDGKVIYQKAFGTQNFSQNSTTNLHTIYDIASITKIAASTSALMKLQSDGLFSLNKTLGDYIPEIVANTPFANIELKEMMAHQAGFPAWIPFYLKTLSNGKPDPYYYSKTKTANFSVPVAKDLWIRNNYPDTIYDRILSSNLKYKNYVYSDLGYYFVKKIIEKLSKEKMEDFLQDSIYGKLGLQTMTFNPYKKFDLSRIAPTEDDKTFRKQIIQGYVHDPGAAMMGGVGGHAGIFSTANDLAILMQMMLNDGYYGGVHILKKEVLDEYTAVQFANVNRRGAGFDKPNLNGSAATACAMASPRSFGHSGFTGTLAWADPTYKINYIFLSNRVYPDAENWKIVKMDIRTNIQTKIYQAIQATDNYNFLQ